MSITGYLVLTKKDDAPEDLPEEIVVSDFGLEEGGIEQDRETGEFYEDSIYLGSGEVKVTVSVYANSGGENLTPTVHSEHYEILENSLNYDDTKIRSASENWNN